MKKQVYFREQNRDVLAYIAAQLETDELNDMLYELAEKVRVRKGGKIEDYYNEFYGQLQTLCYEYNDDKDNLDILKNCPQLELLDALYEYYGEKVLNFLNLYIEWRAEYEISLAVEEYISMLNSKRKEYAYDQLLSMNEQIADYNKKNDVTESPSVEDSTENDNDGTDKTTTGEKVNSDYRNHKINSDFTSSGFDFPLPANDPFTYIPSLKGFDVDKVKVDPNDFFYYIAGVYQNDPASAKEMYQDYMAYLEIFKGNFSFDDEYYETMERLSKIIEALFPELIDEEYSQTKEAQPPRDPLVIDLGKNGIELTGLEDGVHFDLDKNGFAEKTAWIGTEDGFLALDRNGNGFIDDGGELFGDQVIMSNGETAASGFEALKDLDTNDDGIINQEDEQFNNLRV